MENACKEDNIDSSSTGVFELPGEPAVVINGVPPVSLRDGTLFLCETVSDAESHRNTRFGDWLIGREVQKKFGELLHNGKVAEFDKVAGWYKVAYEDGDFEDLEWHELQEVLLPLDITVPLKTLASKVIKKRQRYIQKSGRSVSRSRNHQISGNQGEENGAMFVEALSTKFSNSSYKMSENGQQSSIDQYNTQGPGTANS